MPPFADSAIHEQQADRRAPPGAVEERPTESRGSPAHHSHHVGLASSHFNSCASDGDIAPTAKDVRWQEEIDDVVAKPKRERASRPLELDADDKFALDLADAERGRDRGSSRLDSSAVGIEQRGRTSLEDESLAEGVAAGQDEYEYQCGEARAARSSDHSGAVPSLRSNEKSCDLTTTASGASSASHWSSSRRRPPGKSGNPGPCTL